MSYTLLLLIQLSLLSVLAVFGLHRLLMVCTYVRTRRSGPARPTLSDLPRVCIQLPLYNEGALVERLVSCIAAIDYPAELLEVQILDDSTDARSRRASEQALARLRQKGICADLLTRKTREGFKAGALAAGLRRSDAPFVAIFDADFMPTANFLRSCLPYFTDPAVDMVQCRWEHSNRNESLLTRAEAVLLDAHFSIEHQARAARGFFFNFNGTAGVWRTAAIERAGGWQGDTLTEDLDLSYRAQLAGSRFVYLPEHGVPAELPSSVAAFRSQQQRWTKGSIEVFGKLAARIFCARIPLRLKIESFFHLGANFCYPVLLLAGVLLTPMMLSLEPSVTQASVVSGLQHNEVLQRGLRYSFGIGFWSVALFFFVAALHSRMRSSGAAVFGAVFLDVLLALLCGLALSFSNTVAIIEALRGKKTAFVRTPKSASLQGTPRKGISAVESIELLLCLYFGFGLWLSLQRGKYELLAFCALFFLAFSSLSLLNLNARLLRRNSIRAAALKPQAQAS